MYVLSCSRGSVAMRLVCAMLPMMGVPSTGPLLAVMPAIWAICWLCMAAREEVVGADWGTRSLQPG